MLLKIVILTLTVLSSDGTFETDLYIMPSFEKCVEVAESVSAKFDMVPHNLTCQEIKLGGSIMLDTYVKQGLVPRIVDREQAAHIVRTLGGSVFEFFKLYNKREQFFDTLDIDNFLGV